jgi:hypothetical protein
MLQEEAVGGVRIHPEPGVRDGAGEVALIGHGKQPVERSPTHEHRQPEPAQGTPRRIAAGEPGGACRELRARGLRGAAGLALG